MDLTAFITSLVTSFLIFALLALFYTWLSRRPGNFVIYHPNRVVKGLGSPDQAKNRGPFSWIKEAWQASEDDIVATGGIDEAVYLIFLGSMLSILLYTAIYSLPVLVALSASDHKDRNPPKNDNSTRFNGLDSLAMGNITQKSSRLWAFVIGAYWMSFATYFVVWKAYRHVVRLRSQDRASPKAKPEHFAVLVRDIPRPSKGTYAEEVDAFFRKLHPDTYERTLVVCNIRKVLKIWKKLESYRQKLAHAEAVYEETKTTENPEGRRQQHKTGWVGLMGPKVDSTEFYKEKMKELLPKLEEEQKRAMVERQQRAAFVFFNSRAAASSAGQTMHGEYANKWIVELAPEPREIVWSNLWIPMAQRMGRQIAVNAVVFVTICFYMIPIVFISALISLNNLQEKLPFLRPLVKRPAINSILQAYLPQIALLVFLALLPMVLLKLSKLEGIPAHSHIQRAAAAKYFYFIVFTVFLGVTLASSAFNALEAIVNKPKYVMQLLSATIPPQATFFISYVSLKFLVGYGLELSRFLPLLIYHFKRKYLCKTEEELRKAWMPGPLNYATTVPGDMLVVTIALCYAIIAPMILPFTIAYFAVGWLVMRNQVLNVYVPRFESGGRMWPHMHSHILAALFVSQLTMLGYFGSKEFAYSPLLVPLPISTLVFAYICYQFYYPSFSAIPLSAACNEVKEMPSIPAIVEAYTPACLLPEEKLEDPEKLEDGPEKFKDPEKFEDASSKISSRTSSGKFEDASSKISSRTSSGRSSLGS